MNAPQDVFTPPHSVEAEQSVLGALLVGGVEAWDRVSDTIAEADFYRDDHRRIYRTIGLMHSRGDAVDINTVGDALRDSNEADQTGGFAYLAEMAAATFTIAMISGYARIVKEKALHRDLVAASWEIQSIAMAPGSDPVRLRMDACEAKILAVAGTGTAKDEPKPIAEIIGHVLNGIEERFAREGGITGLPTGFADIDDMLDGLMPGDLIILAGRPSMGKTALALNMAEHCAVELRKAAMVFSLEMGEQQLGIRSLASIGQVNSRALQSGRMQDPDWERLTLAVGKLHEAPLIVDQSVNLTAAQMWSRARRQMRKTGLSLIVIDYLQLMPIAAGSGNNRATDLGDITRTLKHMARDLNVPVICLSQLSRRVEERADKRPMMNDLRESGAIEQDADVIAMLYRDDYYNPDSQSRGMAEFIVRKNRMGETGTRMLVFHPEYSRFLSASREQAYAAIEAASSRKGRRAYVEE